MINKTCCFTGHREIPNEKFNIIRTQVENAIKNLIELGVQNFVCGGAIGFDMLCEELIIDIKKEFKDIQLTLALPCKNQNKFFCQADKEKYDFLLANADHIVYTSDNYFKGCMHKRNRYMVDNASYLIAYCIKNSGGSFYTKNYAKRRGITVFEIV